MTLAERLALAPSEEPNEQREARAAIATAGCLYLVGALLCATAEAAADLTKQLSGVTGLLKDMIGRAHMTPNPRDLSGVLVAGLFEQRAATVIGTWPVERGFVEALASGQIQ